MATLPTLPADLAAQHCALCRISAHCAPTRAPTSCTVPHGRCAPTRTPRTHCTLHTHLAVQPLHHCPAALAHVGGPAEDLRGLARAVLERATALHLVTSQCERRVERVTSRRAARRWLAHKGGRNKGGSWLGRARSGGVPCTCRVRLFLSSFPLASALRCVCANSLPP